ncbi:hypothetical protein BGZ94_007046 [Podila epigama]|nr:hypothetical protein BGZ94_007046 [Podila epigama]
MADRVNNMNTNNNNDKGIHGDGYSPLQNSDPNAFGVPSDNSPQGSLLQLNLPTSLSLSPHTDAPLQPVMAPALVTPQLGSAWPKPFQPMQTSVVQPLALPIAQPIAQHCQFSPRPFLTPQRPGPYPQAQRSRQYPYQVQALPHPQAHSYPQPNPHPHHQYTHPHSHAHAHSHSHSHHQHHHHTAHPPSQQPFLPNALPQQQSEPNWSLFPSSVPLFPSEQSSYFQLDPSVPQGSGDLSIHTNNLLLSASAPTTSTWGVFPDELHSPEAAVLGSGSSYRSLQSMSYVSSSPSNSPSSIRIISPVLPSMDTPSDNTTAPGAIDSTSDLRMFLLSLSDETSQPCSPPPASLPESSSNSATGSSSTTVKKMIGEKIRKRQSLQAHHQLPSQLSPMLFSSSSSSPSPSSSHLSVNCSSSNLTESILASSGNTNALADTTKEDAIFALFDTIGIHSAGPSTTVNSPSTRCSSSEPSTPSAHAFCCPSPPPLLLYHSTTPSGRDAASSSSPPPAQTTSSSPNPSSPTPSSTQQRFACPHCGRTFERQYNLNAHVRTHTGARVHSCDICHKAFLRPYDLSRHQRIHNNLRPYICRLCGRVFIRNDAIWRHYRNNHRGHPDVPISRVEKRKAQLSS